ncbi:MULTISPECIES: replication protein P [Cronobacter]|uniref:replication protein P n=1 Tax=Cronobacter TaxID=413496 RepID=UPI000BE8A024|nr:MULTISPECIES: replication protein P [Cronobacter]NCH53529.1 replication protein [Cronobacter muytjensii]PQV82300.1 replication protein [Cronobacter sakazakii]HDK7323742.1 replication protein [Cronobacter sakazakii]
MNQQRVFSAIQARDGDALARMADPDTHRQVHRDGVVNIDAARLVDDLFVNLKQVFPAAAQTNLRTVEQEAATKRQWIAAFAESGIRAKQLVAGMRKARASQSPFWPSPGQFIAWCRSGETVLGIGLDDVMAEFHRYNRDKGLYDRPEAFPWKHRLLYWIVCDARQAMYQQCLSESEVEKFAARKLDEWARRVAAGEEIPEPVGMLESRSQKTPDSGSGEILRYQPNAAMLGSVTPAQWMLEEYRRRKAAGYV